MSELDRLLFISSRDDFGVDIGGRDVQLEIDGIDNDLQLQLNSKQQSPTLTQVSLEYGSQQSMAELVRPISLGYEASVRSVLMGEILSYPPTQMFDSPSKTTSLEEQIDAHMKTNQQTSSTVPQADRNFSADDELIKLLEKENIYIPKNNEIASLTSAFVASRDDDGSSFSKHLRAMSDKFMKSNELYTGFLRDLVEKEWHKQRINRKVQRESEKVNPSATGEIDVCGLETEEAIVTEKVPLVNCNVEAPASDAIDTKELVDSELADFAADAVGTSGIENSEQDGDLILGTPRGENESASVDITDETDVTLSSSEGEESDASSDVSASDAFDAILNVSDDSDEDGSEKLNSSFVNHSNEDLSARLETDELNDKENSAAKEDADFNAGLQDKEIGKDGLKQQGETDVENHEMAEELPPKINPQPDEQIVAETKADESEVKRDNGEVDKSVETPASEGITKEFRGSACFIPADAVNAHGIGNFKEDDADVTVGTPDVERVVPSVENTVSSDNYDSMMYLSENSNENDSGKLKNSVVYHNHSDEEWSAELDGYEKSAAEEEELNKAPQDKEMGEYGLKQKITGVKILDQHVSDVENNKVSEDLPPVEENTDAENDPRPDKQKLAVQKADKSEKKQGLSETDKEVEDSLPSVAAANFDSNVACQDAAEVATVEESANKASDEMPAALPVKGGRKVSAKRKIPCVVDEDQEQPLRGLLLVEDEQAQLESSSRKKTLLGSAAHKKSIRSTSTPLKPHKNCSDEFFTSSLPRRMVKPKTLKNNADAEVGNEKDLDVDAADTEEADHKEKAGIALSTPEGENDAASVDLSDSDAFDAILNVSDDSDEGGIGELNSSDVYHNHSDEELSAELDGNQKSAANEEDLNNAPQEKEIGKDGLKQKIAGVETLDQHVSDMENDEVTEDLPPVEENTDSEKDPRPDDKQKLAVQKADKSEKKQGLSETDEEVEDSFPSAAAANSDSGVAHQDAAEVATAEESGNKASDEMPAALPGKGGRKVSAKRKIPFVVDEDQEQPLSGVLLVEDEQVQLDSRSRSEKRILRSSAEGSKKATTPTVSYKNFGDEFFTSSVPRRMAKPKTLKKKADGTLGKKNEVNLDAVDPKVAEQQPSNSKSVAPIKNSPLQEDSQMMKVKVPKIKPDAAINPLMDMAKDDTKRKLAGSSNKEQLGNPEVVNKKGNKSKGSKRSKAVSRKRASKSFEALEKMAAKDKEIGMDGLKQKIAGVDNYKIADEALPPVEENNDATAVSNPLPDKQILTVQSKADKSETEHGLKEADNSCPSATAASFDAVVAHQGTEEVAISKESGNSAANEMYAALCAKGGRKAPAKRRISRVVHEDKEQPLSGILVDEDELDLLDSRSRSEKRTLCPPLVKNSKRSHSTPLKSHKNLDTSNLPRRMAKPTTLKRKADNAKVGREKDLDVVAADTKEAEHKSSNTNSMAPIKDSAGVEDYQTTTNVKGRKIKSVAAKKPLGKLVNDTKKQKSGNAKKVQFGNPQVVNKKGNKSGVSKKSKAVNKTKPTKAFKEMVAEQLRILLNRLPDAATMKVKAAQADTGPVGTPAQSTERPNKSLKAKHSKSVGFKLPTPEFEESSDSDDIEEKNELAEFSFESSDEDYGSNYSDESEKEKTPEPSTPIQQTQLESSSLANASFLGRTVLHPDNKVPTWMKTSGQVMIFAVPYNPVVHSKMPATPLSVEWSSGIFEASPPKKRRTVATEPEPAKPKSRRSKKPSKLEMLRRRMSK